MATNKQGNTIFVDAAPQTFSGQKIVAGIQLIATHASNDAVLELATTNSGNPDIVKFRIPASEKSRLFDLGGDLNLVFPQGLYVKTVTDAEATLILKRSL